MDYISHLFNLTKLYIKGKIKIILPFLKRYNYCIILFFMKLKSILIIYIISLIISCSSYDSFEVNPLLEESVSTDDNSKLDPIEFAKGSSNIESSFMGIQEIINFSLGINSLLPVGDINPFLNKAPQGQNPNLIKPYSKEQFYLSSSENPSGYDENGNYWEIIKGPICEYSFEYSSTICEIVIKVIYNNQNDERKESIITLKIDIKNTPQDKSDDTIVGYEEEITYRDNSNGFHILYDLDQPKDNNLFAGTGRNSLKRNYTQSDKVKFSEFISDIIFNDPTTNNDDQIFYMSAKIDLFNGNKIFEELIPEEPFYGGEKPKAGLYKLIEEIINRDIKEFQRIVSFKKDNSGLIEETALYKDGGKAKKRITYLSDGLIEISAIDRNNAKTEGFFDRASGIYEITITPPLNADVKKIVEEGTIWNYKETLYGEIKRTLTFKEGSLSWKKMLFNKTRNVTNINIETSEEEKGLVTVIENKDLINSQGIWLNKKGNTTIFNSLQFLDGNSEQNFIMDDPTTNDNPDVKGNIHFFPDRSGEGTINFTIQGEIIIYKVIIYPDGTGKMINEETGEVFPFNY